MAFYHPFFFFCKLTPTDEYLYSLPGSAVLTAISTVIYTAMTSASVYSQDSWKTPSPSVSVVEVDPIATSPTTIQWFDIAEEDSDKGFTSKSPSMPFSVSTPPQEVPSFSMVNDTLPHSKSDFAPSLAKKNAVHESFRSHDGDVGSSKPLGKRFTKRFTKIIIKSQSPKHSRSSKTFRKVMNRLSFLPSKRGFAALKN